MIHIYSMGQLSKFIPPHQQNKNDGLAKQFWFPEGIAMVSNSSLSDKTEVPKIKFDSILTV